MIDQKIDIAVICATKLEFQAVDRALTDSIESMQKERVGSRVYEIQKFAGPEPDSGLTIALLSPEEIGRVPAALAARDLLYHFTRRPDYVILCGIAAADPESGYQLGDVVLPQVIVDYAEQKHSQGQMLLRARQFSIGGWLHSSAVEFSRTDWFNTVPKETVRITKETNKKLRTPADCHYEMGMACGDYVLDDKELVQQILNRLSKDQKYPITTVEMESTAVARAIDIEDDAPQYLVVKSISDFAYGKSDSAQPYARETAAFFLKGLLIELARSNRFASQRRLQLVGKPPKVILRPSTNVEAMLQDFPTDRSSEWRHRAIDGAIEIFRCNRPGNPYGGFTRNQVICDVDNHEEWPDAFGGLSPEQTDVLSIGLAGRDNLGVSGWLKEKGGQPGRIRVLTSPPTPPVLDRPWVHLSFANSDYFTVRSVTELSKIDRQIGQTLLRRAFPERWTTPQARFSRKCIPYHVSAQGIITCRTPNHSKYLLLASISTNHATVTGGWGATMAEQMWAPDRIVDGEPWWVESARPFMKVVKAAETRMGDGHIEDALVRGLSEEFGIDTQKELLHEPLLLCAAIEEDMYFVTFIYLITINQTLESVYQKWDAAPDRAEMGLLAAYQLTGPGDSGEPLNGAQRLTELIGLDHFDAGPHLLPQARGKGEVKGPWHVSSRLRLYALGVHLWPTEFPQLVVRR